LIPISTAWMGDTHLAPLPTSIYGVVLLLAGFAYNLLQRRIIAYEGQKSRLGAAVGANRKGGLSLLLYAIAIPLAYVAPAGSAAIYVAVAAIWLIPDRRIETILER
jgi:uncharacterized membrane protein